jgi:hypothetical protein
MTNEESDLRTLVEDYCQSGQTLQNQGLVVVSTEDLGAVLKIIDTCRRAADLCDYRIKDLEDNHRDTLITAGFPDPCGSDDWYGTNE